MTRWFSDLYSSLSESAVKSWAWTKDQWFKIFKTAKERKLMNYFSIEYRDMLIQEHKLVSATIARLSNSEGGKGFAYYIRNHQHETVNKALIDLKAKKVELEAKIDVIDELRFE